MSDLRIAVKKKYFDEIKAGIKTEEYRLFNEYWKKRLLDTKKEYKTVTVTMGYPKKGDKERQLTYPFIQPPLKKIHHREFGGEHVAVFAIPVGNHPLILAMK